MEIIDCFKKPIVLSSVLCAILFYTNVWKIPSATPYKSLTATKLVRELSGTVATNPTKNWGATTFFLRAKTSKSFDGTLSAASGTVFVKLTSKTPLPLVEKGSRVTLKGAFTPSLFFRAKELQDAHYSPTPLGFIYKMRSKARQKLRALIAFFGESGALLLALVMGSRDALSDSVANAFRTSGTSFILALSGMHLVMYGEAATKSSKKAFGSRASVFISFAIVALFVFFVGFTPSLLRAFIFFTLCTTLGLLKVRSTLPIKVFTTFYIHALIAPSDLNTISFQLSYVAVVAIALFAPALESFFARYFLPEVYESLATSASAFFSTLPLTLFYFGFAAPIGIIAGAVITPFIMLFIAAGVTSLILVAIIPAFATIASPVINALYALILNLLAIFSKAPIWDA